MKLTNETLAGILVIKLCAWEPAFARRLRSLRDREVRLLRRVARLFAFSQCTFSCSPAFVSLTVFAAYVASDPVSHVLTPEKVFVSVSLFSLLRLPLELFPVFVFDLARAGVSLGRMQRFLNCEERDEGAVQNVEAEEEGCAVEIERGSFGWSKMWEGEEAGGGDGDSKAILSEVNLKIMRGSLVAVVGKVGSGKSTLLSAILGDAVKLGGTVRVSGKVTYVPQQAWIINDTLKRNVLLATSSSEVEESPPLYREALSTCGLEEDLRLLPAGDETEIGEEGVTLSGGQRQRVSLARAAVLAGEEDGADLYLLDDPLSAVDAHVGAHIFDRLLSGEGAMLQGKTRVLVTHGVQYLRRADKVVVVDEGRVAEEVVVTRRWG